VSWNRVGADAAATLTITWRELGGPLIKVPAKSGYGSSLIRNLIPHDLGGTVDLQSYPTARGAKLKFLSGEGLEFPATR
jgi:two-component sensor histidine kinase